MDLNLNQVTDLEAQLKAEYETKLRAVEMVKQMLQQMPTAYRGVSPVVAHTPPTNTPKRRGRPPRVVKEEVEAGGSTMSLIGSIQALLEEADRTWSIPAMIGELSGRPGFTFAAQRPESSVNVAVNRLIARHAAVLYRRGSGRIPNLYKAAKWAMAANGFPKKERETPDVLASGVPK